MSDPFELLGLERRFRLTLEEIDTAWRGECWRHHPDRPGGSASRTLALNEARRTLRDPFLRGSALLGVSEATLQRHAPSTEFLEWILEQRESPEPAAIEARWREVLEDLEREPEVAALVRLRYLQRLREKA